MVTLRHVIIFLCVFVMLSVSLFADTVHFVTGVFFTEDLLSMDPAAIANKAEWTAGDMLYQQLTTIDEQGVPCGEIADSWIYNTQDMTLTVILREDIIFSNGSQLTADDVVYSLIRANELAEWLISDRLLLTKDYVRKTGSFEVTLSLQKPYAESLVLSLLSTPVLSIIHKASHEHDGSFVGSGAYIFDYNNITEEEYIFTLRDPATPHSVSIQTVSDSIEEIIRYNAGEADVLCYTQRRHSVMLDNAKSYTRYTVPTDHEFALLFMNETHPLLKNKNLQQAIRHAIPYERIVQYAIGVPAARRHTILSRGMPGYHGDDTFFRDVSTAQWYLVKAKEELGLSEDEPLVFTIEFLDNQINNDIFEHIRVGLAEIGISVVNTHVSVDYLYDGLWEHTVEYAMFLDGIGTDHADPDAITVAFTSGFAAHATQFKDKELIELASKAALTQDPVLRASYYRHLARRISFSGPFIPICNYTKTVIVRKEKAYIIPGFRELIRKIC